MTFSSHTIVKNGMPFIEPVLRQVIPFANRCLVTISDRSNDGTIAVLRKLVKEFPDKIMIYHENVVKPSDLTQERQKLLDYTTEDWVLFLDSDDLWPTESLKYVLSRLNEDVDAFAFNPHQMVDWGREDISWKYKWFTKWFRKQEGVHYRKPWPSDLIYKGDEMLYWRKNKRVMRLPVRYFHVAKLMNWRFRDEEEFKKYYSESGNVKPLSKEVLKVFEDIYGS